MKNNALRNDLQSVNSSNNVGGDINLGSLVGTSGTPRIPSQQSLKNHSRHQSASVPPSTSRNVCQMTEIEGPCIHVRTSSRNLGSTRNQQSITKMLLLISTVFILLNLPSYVIRLCVFFFALAKKNTPELLWCLQQFFMLLYYTNFSINFLLYAMCGITFRRCLEQMLRRILKSMTRYHRNPQRMMTFAKSSSGNDVLYCIHAKLRSIGQRKTPQEVTKHHIIPD
ncbi:hypothetical protein HN011_003481 [Eciton burchellii]|nr:hypothetical protein HN011_003481 [Eciton burchellii]